MDRKPNVLIFMCDQLNYKVLSCYNGVVNTKNIDRIADSGVLFSNAYCQTPFCTPSRASFITGLYPHHHGLVGNVMNNDYPVIKGPETEEGIDNSDITTEKLLFESGYKTAHYGKWHLSGETLDCYSDMYREHHEYVDHMHDIFADTQKKDRDSYMDWYGWKMPVTISDKIKQCRSNISDNTAKNSRLMDFITKIGRLDIHPEDTFDHIAADKCIDFINNNADNKFMLTCSFNLPHDPNIIPNPYYDMIDINKIKLNKNSLPDSYFNNDLSSIIINEMGDDFLYEFLKTYYASVLFIDEQVGRVLYALESNNLMDDTIIIFTADHGDMAGFHNMFWKSTKAFYDDVAKVPLIISYKKKIKPIKYDGITELVDVMPTLLELTQTELSNKIDGKSLIDYISNDKDDTENAALSERIIWNKEHIRKTDNNGLASYMLRYSRWKYVIYPDGKEFLYDMINDKLENINLSEDIKYHDIIEYMKEKLNHKISKII